jgi:hypothetical protein
MSKLAELYAEFEKLKDELEVDQVTDEDYLPLPEEQTSDMQPVIDMLERLRKQKKAVDYLEAGRSFV